MLGVIRVKYLGLNQLSRRNASKLFGNLIARLLAIDRRESDTKCTHRNETIATQGGNRDDDETAAQAKEIVDEIKFAFPQLVPASNLLEAGFADVGALFHIARLMTNVGRAEAGSPYTQFLRCKHDT